MGTVYDVTVSGGNLASLNATVGLDFAGTITVTDLAGNALPTTEPGTDETYLVDNTAPATTSFTRQTPLTSPTNADVLVFRATFNESVTGLDAADFAVTGTTATITAVSAVSGTVYDVTVSGGNLASLNATVGLDFAGTITVTDLAGNALPTTEPGTDETYLVDNTAPATTSFTRQTPGTSPTNADVLIFRATFNESVTGLDAADFAVTGTTATITAVSAVSGTVYDVTLSGGNLASLNATVGLDFAGTITVTDLAGNALPTTEPGTDETYLVDNTAPATTSFTRQTPPTSPTNADVLVFRATFNEAVTGLDAADFAVTGTTATITAVSAVSGTVYDVTVSGGNLASLNATVGLDFAGTITVADLAGNALPNTEPGTDETYLVDNTVQVFSLAPTTTGFVVDINSILDVTPLNLYDDQSGILGPADVTLIGDTTGTVRGSLILSANHRQATFVATGGPLAPDTYTVTLRSANNGFQDIAGNLLDGNSDGTPGDDFTSTFVITSGPANEVLVSVPDFTRGFGQTVDLPTNADAGIPVTLSTGQNVTKVEFDLVYDSALLTITDFSTSIPGAVSTFSSPSTGVVHVSVSSAAEFSATVGAIELGRFAATVPDTAPYASKQILHITSLNVEDSVPQTRPARADDGVHIAAFVGDSSGNQAYSSGDTTLLQRIIVGSGTGSVAYQLADPLLLMDLDRGGTITSGDATLLQRVIVGTPVAQVQLLPTGTTPPAAGGPDPHLFIPKDLTGAAGSTVTVPVNLLVTATTGITVSGMDIAIAYDESKFTVGNFRVGSLLGTGFAFAANTATPGIIRITFSKDTGPTLVLNEVGSVFEFDLTVDDDAANSGSAINLLQNFSTTVTQVTDNDIKELTLVPAPTNAESDSADGFFTIDNTAPDTTSFTRQTPLTSPTNADTLVFRATFNEAVTGVSATDFAVTGTTATVTAVNAISGTVYDVMVSAGNLPSLSGAVSLDFAASPTITDLAGNVLADTEPAVDETYIVDNVAPTVIRTGPADGSLLGSGPSQILVDFSEPMNQTIVVLSPSDLTLGGVGRGSAAVTGATWVDADTASFTIEGVWGTGQISVQFRGPNLQDLSGNGLVVYSGNFSINDMPTITDIGNVKIDEDTSTDAIGFTIGDSATSAGSLIVSGKSSNQSLVPDANIVFGGSGASRTVMVTPAANQFGTATITVSVDNGKTTASDTFVLTVTPVNDAPTNVSISASLITENVLGAIVGILTVTDPDNEDTFAFSIDDTRFEIIDRTLKLKDNVFLSVNSVTEIVIEVTVVDFGVPPQSRIESLVLSVKQNTRAWQNPTNPLDTNGDGFVSPLDVLVGVNLLNLPTTALLDADKMLPIARPAKVLDPYYYYDVNGDGFASPIDLLQVINSLNESATALASGEGTQSPPNVRSQMTGHAQTPIVRCVVAAQDIVFERQTTFLEPRQLDVDHTRAIQGVGQRADLVPTSDRRIWTPGAAIAEFDNPVEFDLAGVLDDLAADVTRFWKVDQ